MYIRFCMLSVLDGQKLYSFLSGTILNFNGFKQTIFVLQILNDTVTVTHALNKASTRLDLTFKIVDLL